MKVSYYRETSAFINYVKEKKGFEQVQVTGHSLGKTSVDFAFQQTNWR